jgi:hypothetical protein
MRACVGLALVGIVVASQGACSSTKSSGETAKDGGGSTTPPYDIGPDGGVLAPLAQVTIVEVAAFQATKAQIVTTLPIGAQPITPVPLAAPMPANAPVIALRPGQIRLYIDPTNGGSTSWTPHTLSAELDVFESDGTPLVPPMGSPTHVDEKVISAASTDADLSSTFNFLMEPQDLPAGAQFTVTVRDKTAAAGSDASGGAIYPGIGMGNNGANYADMNVQSSGQEGFQYQLVPLEYEVDGSGRLPDETPATLDGIANELMEFYPVDQVTYTVHAAFPWTASDPNEGAIDAAGDGWENVLMQIENLHDSVDHAPSNVWYVASFEPNDNFNDYCVNGCVLGIAFLGASPTNRVCAIAGYGLYAADTLPQELAHTVGEKHAPCPYNGQANAPAAQDSSWPSGIIDPNGTSSTPGAVAQSAAFAPYDNARIGQFGYDIFTRALLDPNAIAPATQYRDYMSYCGSPQYTVWSSDYTFNRMFSEIQYANMIASPKIAQAKKTAPTAYHYVKVGRDGVLRWGIPTQIEYDPEGIKYPATYVAPDGHTMAAGDASFFPLEIGGGLMLVPEGPAGFSELRIDGMSDLKSNRLMAEKKK